MIAAMLVHQVGIFLLCFMHIKVASATGGLSIHKDISIDLPPPPPPPPLLPPPPPLPPLPMLPTLPPLYSSNNYYVGQQGGYIKHEQFGQEPGVTYDREPGYDQHHVLHQPGYGTQDSLYIQSPQYVHHGRPQFVIKEKPTYVYEKPLYIREKPIITQSPSYMVEKPGYIYKKPIHYLDQSVIDKGPVYMVDSPKHIIYEKPTYIRKEPAYLVEGSNYVHKNPTYIHKQPVIYEEPKVMMEQPIGGYISRPNIHKEQESSHLGGSFNADNQNEMYGKVHKEGGSSLTETETNTKSKSKTQSSNNLLDAELSGQSKSSLSGSFHNDNQKSMIDLRSFDEDETSNNEEYIRPQFNHFLYGRYEFVRPARHRIEHELCGHGNNDMDDREINPSAAMLRAHHDFGKFMAMRSYLEIEPLSQENDY